MPDDRETPPAVYARLREDAETRALQRSPSRAVRWLGWALSAAILAVVILTVLRASPW
jgi:hypothetical protein